MVKILSQTQLNLPGTIAENCRQDRSRHRIKNQVKNDLADRQEFPVK